MKTKTPVILMMTTLMACSETGTESTQRVGQLQSRIDRIEIYRDVGFTSVENSISSFLSIEFNSSRLSTEQNVSGAGYCEETINLTAEKAQEIKSIIEQFHVKGSKIDIEVADQAVHRIRLINDESPLEKSEIWLEDENPGFYLVDSDLQLLEVVIRPLLSENFVSGQCATNFESLFTPEVALDGFPQVCLTIHCQDVSHIEIPASLLAQKLQIFLNQEVLWDDCDFERSIYLHFNTSEGPVNLYESSLKLIGLLHEDVVLRVKSFASCDSVPEESAEANLIGYESSTYRAHPAQCEGACQRISAQLQLR